MAEPAQAPTPPPEGDAPGITVRALGPGRVQVLMTNGWLCASVILGDEDVDATVRNLRAAQVDAYNLPSVPA